MQHHNYKDKAIVIGGGIAGLVVARVLSNHFSNVDVLEKDTYPKEKGPRNGTPQANHLHVFLMKGIKIITELFPNIEGKLLSQGAHKINLISDTKYKLPTGWTPIFDSDMNTILCSRQLLEYNIRKEITENYPNIQILENTRVTGLVSSNGAKRKIIGVEAVLDGNKNKILESDLVVDASGRISKTPDWLERLGFERPRATQVNSFIGYATRLIQIPHLGQSLSLASPSIADSKFIAILTNPPYNPRMAVMISIENDLWQLGLLGIGKNYPPTDEQGFLNFIYDLGEKEFYTTVRNAIPVSNIYGYRENGSRRYHYEKIRKFPENFIVLGDAVCAFNPIYAQGITVAALQSKVLDRMLKKQKRNEILKAGFEKKFQKQIAKVNSIPWLLGTGEDLQWSTTIQVRMKDGKESMQKMSWFNRQIQKYSNKIILLAPNSIIATKAFLEVMNMIKSPMTLFNPLLFMMVLKETISSKFNIKRVSLLERQQKSYFHCTANDNKGNAC